MPSIRKSKTDQDGAGVTVAVAKGERPHLCAVRALQDWLNAAGIVAGPVFRRVRAGDRATGDRLSDRSVALIVKKPAEPVGIDPAVVAGHSLRSGGITAAVREATTSGSSPASHDTGTLASCAATSTARARSRTPRRCSPPGSGSRRERDRIAGMF